MIPESDEREATAFAQLPEQAGGVDGRPADFYAYGFHIG